jgi:hypothetical protein
VLRSKVFLPVVPLRRRSFSFALLARLQQGVLLRLLGPRRKAFLSVAPLRRTIFSLPCGSLKARY